MLSYELFKHNIGSNIVIYLLYWLISYSNISGFQILSTSTFCSNLSVPFLRSWNCRRGSFHFMEIWNVGFKKLLSSSIWITLSMRRSRVHSIFVLSSLNITVLSYASESAFNILFLLVQYDSSDQSWQSGNPSHLSSTNSHCYKFEV